ncbi:hypothetical protein [Candidatus Nanohalococcus occultus]|uniref:C2H2-type domain-containing protein n=1 Tax=Candidatus Nanohalococcus occultus TaxID=2978047 RepID=A0ABY8CEX4_9ARCH|nr:hypothetical protein SVXNc_0252 [Candidatus Nanohaloarchaeota archaeon SVXNc]
MKKGRKLSLVLISVLVLIGYGSAAAEVDISPEDQVVWLNDNVVDKKLNAELRCTGEDVDIEDYAILDSSSNRIYPTDEPDLSTNTTDLVYGPDETESWVAPEPGKYFVKLECSSGSDTFESFYYDRLSVEISSPEEDSSVYTGTEREVEVSLTSPADQLNYGQNFDNVKLRLNGEQIGQEEIQFASSTKVNVDIPKDAIQGTASLEAEVAYEESSQSPTTWTETTSNEVDVKDWKIETTYNPSQRLPSNRLSELNMTVKIMREGEPVKDLGPRHFFIEQGEESANTGDYEWFSGEFEGVTSDERFAVYNLELQKMPKLQETKDYELDIRFKTGGDTDYDQKVGTVYVEKKFTFEGRVSDSDSRAIETAFRLQDDEYIEQFETNSRGFFSRRVMPGGFGMDVTFPRGGLVLNDVELSGDYSGNINYQYYENPGEVEGVDLQGIDPINMMAVSFGYPFDSGSGSIQYNPAKTEDPMNVDLYECQRWNFWGEDCISGWDKVDEEDVTLPPTKWKAEFPVTPVETSEYGDEKQVLYSAYVIGTNSGLALDRLGLESYRVPSNEQFRVEGRAVTKGRPIENADVRIELLDGSQVVKSSSTTTDEEGVFSMDVETPEAGNYSLKAEISKGSYRPYSETLDSELEVYRQKSMSLDMPDSIEVGPGNTVEKIVTVENDGQTAFEDAALTVSESDLDISFSDSGFSVEPGEEKDITVSITVPEGFCDPSCVKYPTSDILLESDGFSEEFDLGVEIVEDSGAVSGSTENQQSDDSDQGTQNSPIPVTPAGQFLASQSSLNIALGLITVFSLALASAVKKKKGSEENDRGSRTINLQRPKVEPANSSDDEIDAVAENLDADGVDAVAEAMTEQDESQEDGEQESQDSEPQDDEDEEIEALAEAMKEEEENIESGASEESDEQTDEESTGQEADQEVTCDVCGESFDTESGMKLHKQAFH